VRLRRQRIESMAGHAKLLLYIVVVDESGASSFRYTRSLLHSTLQLMGCKPRHAFEISRRVFDVVRGDPAEMEMLMAMSQGKRGVQRYELPDAATSPRQFQFELYKRRTTVLIPRDLFLHLVCQALALYKYLAPNQRNHLTLACRSAKSLPHSLPSTNLIQYMRRNVFPIFSFNKHFMSRVE
uniref:Uncharacterized protein n=1 Tax=Aegilops tauschii subsp. strangulata TaxID=200361 RepID=A0A453GYY3_AEGTS